MPAETSINVDQLSTMISHAVAPAFLLGAIAALVSILINRMAGVSDRIRNLNQIADGDTARMWLKADIARLKRREILLNQALQLAVVAGIAITILLLFGFVVAFLGYRHEPGAGALFIVALCLLAGSLFRFLQDARISVSEHDHHH
jgi:ABC-type spermidine/putrescine transport system permease subunit I